MTRMNLWFLVFSPGMLLGQDFKNSGWLTNGQRIREVTENNLDAQGDFFRILTYQNIHNRSLMFFGVNYRTAPGNFVLHDGSVTEDYLNRIQVVMGTGIGEHFFAGIVADAVENGELGNRSASAFQTNISQGLVYGGFRTGAVQTSVAWQSVVPQSGVARGGALINQRDFSDWRLLEVKPPDENRFMANFYHQRGLFAAATIVKPVLFDAASSVWYVGDQTIDWYVQYQSPKRWLPARFGLPFIRVDRVATSGDLSNPQPIEQKWVNSLGSDDIRLPHLFESIGFRTAIQYEIKPQIRFRHFESSARWNPNAFIEVGFRTFIHNLHGSPALSTDEYIALGWTNKARWMFTHSYNSPDNRTFVPIKGIHVFGFQIVYGISDIIKPLIPMIRATSAEIN